MRARAIITVLLLGALAFLVFQRKSGDAADRAHEAVNQAQADGPSREKSTSNAEPARARSELAPSPLAPTSHQPETSPEGTNPPLFPADYTGVRDSNMATLFASFTAVAKGAAERLSEAKLSPDDALAAEARFLQFSAYCTLIQEQRHFYYGYETAVQRRYQAPRNTADVVYHTTGMNDMNVVFELRRSDFPDLFDRMDAMSAVEPAGGSTHRIGQQPSGSARTGAK